MRMVAACPSDSVPGGNPLVQITSTSTTNNILREAQAESSAAD